MAGDKKEPREKKDWSYKPHFEGSPGDKSPSDDKEPQRRPHNDESSDKKHTHEFRGEHKKSEKEHKKSEKEHKKSQPKKSAETAKSADKKVTGSKVGKSVAKFTSAAPTAVRAAAGPL